MIRVRLVYLHVVTTLFPHKLHQCTIPTGCAYTPWRLLGSLDQLLTKDAGSVLVLNTALFYNAFADPRVMGFNPGRYRPLLRINIGSVL